MRRLVLAALFVGFRAAGPVYAAKSAGGASFDFLNLDANARAVALGGAYTALASDANALLYNPAGLARTPANDVTFMHNQYVEGLTQEYLGFAGVSGFGAQLNYLRLGDLTRTRVDAPDGTLGSFDLSDLALAGGYGRQLYDGALSLGAGLKYVREDVAGVAAQGAAFDVGAMAAPPSLPGLTLGLSLLNAGPNVKFASQSSPLPTAARLGAGYAFEAAGARHTAAVDLSRQRDDALRWGLGLESIVARVMALRLGFTSRNDAGIGISAGVGWVSQALAVDYAFSPYGDLGMAHRLSLSWRWGARAPTEPKPLPIPKPSRRRAEVDAAPADPTAALPSAASVQARFDRVDALLAAQRYNDAIKELARIDGALVDDDGRRVRYHERLGTIALKRKDCPAAKPHFIEALRQASALGLSDSTVAEAYAGIGFCLLEQQNEQYAGRFLRKALEAGPTEPTRRAVELKLRALGGR